MEIGVIFGETEEDVMASMRVPLGRGDRIYKEIKVEKMTGSTKTSCQDIRLGCERTQSFNIVLTAGTSPCRRIEIQT